MKGAWTSTEHIWMQIYVKFGVLIAVNTKIVVFWSVSQTNWFRPS
jgi:hypothetical protein